MCFWNASRKSCRWHHVMRPTLLDAYLKSKQARYVYMFIIVIFIWNERAMIVRRPSRWFTFSSIWWCYFQFRFNILAVVKLTANFCHEVEYIMVGVCNSYGPPFGLNHYWICSRGHNLLKVGPIWIYFDFIVFSFI